MKDRILALLREKGPMFPAEVSAKLGGNSFLAKAYLSELVSSGAIRADSLGLKEGFIYFLPGQEKIAEKKVSDVLSFKRTPSMYSSGNRNVSPEVAEKQKKFSQLTNETLKKDKEMEMRRRQKMREIEERKKSEAQKRSAEKHPSKPSTNSYSSSQNSASVSAPVPEKKQEEKKESFEDIAMNFISRNSITIVEELETKKKKELSLIVEVPTPIGNMPFFCKVRNKKKINDTDLSLVHSEAVSRNMNALFITGGSLSKAAKSFLEKTDNLIVKKLS